MSYAIYIHFFLSQRAGLLIVGLGGMFVACRLTNRVHIERDLRRHHLVPLEDDLYTVPATGLAPDAAERMHEGGIGCEVPVNGPGLNLRWALGQLSDDVGDISYW